MKQGIFIVGTLFLFCLSGCSSIFNSGSISVLVFSKTEQFRHTSIENGIANIMALGDKHGFRVDTTEDSGIFTQENLQNYNVVVFLNTTGDILNDAQQIEFQRFIQAGGGFVGIHAAADTEYGWPWYGKLVGAYFHSHPNNPNVREGDIDVLIGDHGSTSMLPVRWHCNDEWYNYKDINPDIKVLMNLDETSYEGGINGEAHPIAWYHEYDGGRAWYTGRGHTDESFDEPLFQAHILGGIQYAAGDGSPVNYNLPSVMPQENRFEKVVLEDNLNEPMELVMMPNGNLLYIQRAGEIRLYDQAVDSSTLVQKMDVFSGLEDGLLGVALDPDFEENNWIYLFYADPNASKQNISRFTMSSDYKRIDLASEQLLLEVPTQRKECCHAAGSIEFGPNGLLYIATGDNTNPHASDGYSPSDERPGRSPWDAQKSSANTMDLRGKILRIKPEANGSYSIPEGNLFADESEGRPEIYVMGCRNPYRISIDSHTGYLYWGDVGPDAGNDSTGRGPRGHDEVNQAREAGFFGWPYFIADNKPYHEYDFAKKVSIKPHDPQHPINNSPNNTGATNLPPANPAFIYYPYAASAEFPLVGDGGRNAMAGPVFYKDDYPESENRFPDYYDGKFFAYDWMRGWIMSVTMNDEGDLMSMERLAPSIKWNNPTDIIMGPTGDMYLLEYGTVWFSQNPDARLVHFKYNGGNRKPVANIEADQTIGGTPLTIAFKGDESIDFDGDDLRFNWYFEDENQVGSNEMNPTHTFENPGNYDVKLVIEDENGEIDEASLEVLVGNDLPEISWNFEGNRTFFWDKQSLSYEVMVQDEEDGTIGNGIDENDVQVSIEYLAQGFDPTEIEMGHQAMTKASGMLKGKALMDDSDCGTCHQVDVKSVGPTYQDIAAKYKDDPNASGYLANKIINGGGGVWGETAMAAHPQLSQEDAGQMAQFILSMANDPSKSINQRPAKGTYAFDQHPPNNPAGKYLLTASYTDQGGEEVGPLSVQDRIILRHPMIMAAEFDAIEKAQKFTVTPEMSNGAFPQEMEIVIGMSGGYVVYKNIDLTDIKAIQFTVSLGGGFFGGGKMLATLDGLDEPNWLEIPVAPEDGGLGGSQLNVNTPETTGVHDLYIKFEGDGARPVLSLIGMYFSRVALDENI